MSLTNSHTIETFIVLQLLKYFVSQALGGGAVASGGLRDLIPCVARTCVVAGLEGIFMECHDDPNSSPCDAPTQWPLRNLKELLEELKAIAAVTKGKQEIKIDLTPAGDDWLP